MTNINCALAPLNAGLALSAQLVSRLQQTLTDTFSSASTNAIQLSVSVSNAPPPYPQGTPVSAYQLHASLTNITGNSPTPLNIAVLYGSTYGVPWDAAARAAFGVMFDCGFKTYDDPNDVMQLPRIGCAVFLDTIAAQRQPAQFADEVVFTTLHELGHLFNLGHIQDGMNIMTTGGSTSVVDQRFWDFEVVQKSWLQNCGFDSRVTPGAILTSGMTAARVSTFPCDGLRVRPRALLCRSMSARASSFSSSRSSSILRSTPVRAGTQHSWRPTLTRDMIAFESMSRIR